MIRDTLTLSHAPLITNKRHEVVVVVVFPHSSLFSPSTTADTANATRVFFLKVVLYNWTDSRLPACVLCVSLSVDRLTAADDSSRLSRLTWPHCYSASGGYHIGIQMHGNAPHFKRKTLFFRLGSAQLHTLRNTTPLK